MKIIKSTPEACCKNGGNYWASSEHNYFLVLDGASCLHKDIVHKESTCKDNTDTQCYLKRFADLIKRYIDTVIPVKELVIKCISELKDAYTSLTADSTHNAPFHELSASMALIKRTGDIFELLVIGDITVLIKYENGKVLPAIRNSVHKLDQQARDKRNNMNETGYCILGLQEEVVNDAMYVQIFEPSISKILVCSDRFAAAYYDKKKLAVDTSALMKAAEKQTFSRMLRKIRSTEKKI